MVIILSVRWKRNNIILYTLLVLLYNIHDFHFIIGLLSAGAMGFWHGVEYYEKERVVGDEFYQQWNNVSIPDQLYTYQHDIILIIINITNNISSY